MARGVDQVESVLDFLAAAFNFSVVVAFKPRRRPVPHPRRVQLDRDPPLALEVHAVEELRLHVAVGDGARLDQQDVGEGRFPKRFLSCFLEKRSSEVEEEER